LNTNCPNWTSKSYNPELPYGSQINRRPETTLKKEKRKIILIKAQNTHARAKIAALLTYLDTHKKQKKHIRRVNKRKRQGKRKEKKRGHKHLKVSFLPCMNTYQKKHAKLPLSHLQSHSPSITLPVNYISLIIRTLLTPVKSLHNNLLLQSNHQFSLL